MNKIILCGNCVAKPELRTTQNNTDVATFTLAINEKYKEETKTEYVNCVCFGSRASVLNKYVDKGNKLLVEGSIRTTTYEKDGLKRYDTKVVVSNFEFVGSSQSGAQRGAQKQEEPKKVHTVSPYEEFAQEITEDMLPF